MIVQHVLVCLQKFKSLPDLTKITNLRKIRGLTAKGTLQSRWRVGMDLHVCNLNLGEAEAEQL